MDVSVQEAKNQLSRLLELIEEGEDVVIHQNGRAVARLVAMPKPSHSPFGAMRGEFTLPEGWDRSLTSDEAEAFWRGEW